MNKKTLLIIALLALLLIVYVVYANYANKSNLNIKTTTTKELIGGETDEHGCLIGAGYQWCPSSQECQRLWEGNCEPDFIKTVTFVETKDNWIIYYEEPGKPALTTAFLFDSNCSVNGASCQELKFKTGDKADIKGITVDDYILITELSY